MTALLILTLVVLPHVALGCIAYRAALLDDEAQFPDLALYPSSLREGI